MLRHSRLIVRCRGFCFLPARRKELQELLADRQKRPAAPVEKLIDWSR
jgi:hypothetical protein